MKPIMKNVLIAVATLAMPLAAQAQGTIRGAEEGAAAGGRAGGPVGAIVGGAVGAATGTVGGILGVADVRYDRRWLTRLNSVVRLLRSLGLGIILLLAFASALTVANVVRLAASAGTVAAGCSGGTPWRRW